MVAAPAASRMRPKRKPTQNTLEVVELFVSGFVYNQISPVNQWMSSERPDIRGEDAVAP